MPTAKKCFHRKIFLWFGLRIIGIGYCVWLIGTAFVHILIWMTETEIQVDPRWLTSNVVDLSRAIHEGKIDALFCAMP